MYMIENVVEFTSTRGSESLSDLPPGSDAEGKKDERRLPAALPPQHRGPQPPPSDRR